MKTIFREKVGLMLRIRDLKELGSNGLMKIRYFLSFPTYE